MRYSKTITPIYIYICIYIYIHMHTCTYTDDTYRHTGGIQTCASIYRHAAYSHTYCLQLQVLQLWATATATAGWVTPISLSVPRKPWPLSLSTWHSQWGALRLHRVNVAIMVTAAVTVTVTVSGHSCSYGYGYGSMNGWPYGYGYGYGHGYVTVITRAGYG